VTAPRYEFDPTWPRELPDGWVMGQIGSVCTDTAGHVLALDRMNLTDEEAETGRSAPPVLVFDTDGTLVRSWGDPDVVPFMLHGSFIDHERNVWLTGMHDGIVQKYTWDGELLLQIGDRGQVDSSDGTQRGAPLNSSRTRFFNPAAVAIDPETGDIYVADGYGNRRVVVLDREGTFLRQWGRQGTKAEAEAGTAGTFMQVVHGIAISRAGLVYVCDRQGDRIQVFERDGTFVRNIWVRTGTAELPDPRGTAWWTGFSPDEDQTYLFVMDGRNEQVHVLDHSSGRIVGSFGRPGHMAGAFTHGHSLAVDADWNVYVGETHTGRRIQRFRRSDR
jgi:DNA-binding beta-propeller fold protein YncE